MADPAELIVNALTGLAGALVGGFFAMRAADRTHERARKAARDDEARRQADLMNARAWQLMHSANLYLGVLHGSVSSFAQIRALRPSLNDEDLWRFVEKGDISANISPFNAENLLALINVGQGRLINEVLDLESDVLSLIAQVRAYSEMRQHIERLHGKALVGKTTAQLIEIDPQITGLVSVASSLERNAKAYLERATATLARLVDALRPKLLELGLNKIEVMSHPGERE